MIFTQGYSIGPSALQFDLSIQISLPGGSASAGTTSRSETLTLSPSVPVAVSSSRLVSARLQGDLAMYAQMPVLRWECMDSLLYCN